MGSYVKPMHGLWKEKSVLLISTFLHQGNRFPKTLHFSFESGRNAADQKQRLPKTMCSQNMGGLHYCLSI